LGHGELLLGDPAIQCRGDAPRCGLPGRLAGHRQSDVQPTFGTQFGDAGTHGTRTHDAYSYDFNRVGREVRGRVGRGFAVHERTSRRTAFSGSTVLCVIAVLCAIAVLVVLFNASKKFPQSLYLRF
jgi:hypothetical protein